MYRGVFENLIKKISPDVVLKTMTDFTVKGQVTVHVTLKNFNHIRKFKKTVIMYGNVHASSNLYLDKAFQYILEDLIRDGLNLPFNKTKSK